MNMKDSRFQKISGFSPHKDKDVGITLSLELCLWSKKRQDDSLSS